MAIYFNGDINYKGPPESFHCRFCRKDYKWPPVDGGICGNEQCVQQRDFERERNADIYEKVKAAWEVLELDWECPPGAGWAHLINGIMQTTGLQDEDLLNEVRETRRRRQ